SISATALSIDPWSSRSIVSEVFTGVDTGFRSSAVTFAPSSWQMRATCSPMPDAAPVTTTCLPSYPRTSFIARSLTLARGERDGARHLPAALCARVGGITRTDDARRSSVLGRGGRAHPDAAADPLPQERRDARRIADDHRARLGKERATQCQTVAIGCSIE